MNYDISKFKKDFPDDRTCLEYVFSQKFPGRGCPCKKEKLYPLKGRKSYLCPSCLRHVAPLKGTIFEKSRTPLSSWFLAIYLTSQTKNGISSAELQRLLGVTYKTAWRMNSKIRSLLTQNSKPLFGIVEADETYMGWRRGQPINGPRAIRKTPVLGAVKRNGELRAKAVLTKGLFDVIPFITQNVRKGSQLMTDEALTYKSVAKWGYKHRYVTHSKWQWAKGNVHTNTVEGAWSQIKRSVAGTYHGVSRQHLQSYLDYLVFLRNSRLSSKNAFHQILDRL